MKMPASDQKVSTDRYSLIPRTLIFLTDDRPPEPRVLLLRGAPHKRLWAGLYNGVGGHVEREEDVLSSARRELLEETGYTADSLWLAGVITIDTGGYEPLGSEPHGYGPLGSEPLGVEDGGAKSGDGSRPAIPTAAVPTAAPPANGVGVCVFVLRGTAGGPDRPPLPSREGELEWVPLSRLASLPAVEDLPTLLPRVLASAPGSPPFFAHYRYDAQGMLVITFASEP